MRVLTPEIIKKIFKEEIEKKLKNENWDKKLNKLQKELDVYSNEKNEPKKSLISPGLEVKDKEGNLYTVEKVKDDTIWLTNPLGKFIKLNTKRLKEFEID